MSDQVIIMSKSKSREQLSRTDVADRLSRLAEQIRGGNIAVGSSANVIVPDQVELETEIEDDELKLEIKWEQQRS